MNFIKSTFIASVLCVSSIAQAGSSGDPLNIDRVLVTDSFHTIYFPVETANLEGCGDAKKVSFYREDYAHTSISYPFSTASFTASAAGLNIRHSLSFQTQKLTLPKAL